MRYILSVLIVISALIYIESSNAAAVTRSAGDGAALAKAQMMLRQLQQENLALESENQKLQKQLGDIEKKIDAIKNDKSRLSQRLESSQNIIDRYKENSDALRDRITQDRERMQELIAKFKELIQAFRVVEFEKAQLQTSMESNKKDLLNCAENNLKLVQTNKELVNQYVNKGVWDSFKQAEPVTQLTRVEVENLAQEYEATINLLKITLDEQGL